VKNRASRTHSRAHASASLSGVIIAH
jgi:hypothetical protein